MATSVPDDFTFPHGGYPTGWFHVAWDQELEAGQVRPLRYFGLDLVLFRNMDGEVAILDGHCPHMGAHIGHGGWVEGCEVVCPFHGWRWSVEGRNTMVPPNGSGRDKPRLRAWDVRVRNGLIWVWYDAAGGGPTWDIPELIHNPEHYYPLLPDCAKVSRNVKVRPQYVIENLVDAEHFTYVHGATGEVKASFTAEGPIGRSELRIELGAGKERTWLTPDGPREAVTISQVWGLGGIFAPFDDTDGSILIQTITPVDEEHSDYFTTVYFPRSGDTGDDLPPAGQKRVREQFTQPERDFLVWENMWYPRKPVYARGEGRAMTSIRKWCASFYPPQDGVRTEPALADPVEDVPQTLPSTDGRALDVR